MRSVDPDFGEFVEAHGSRLLGLGYALTGNPHDAWDLFQEALTRVGLRWPRLRDGDPLAYARTVMVRLNIDRVRRLRREIPVFQVRESAAPVVELGSIDPWLSQALSQATPRQRTALALRFFEDLPLAEIAERMGCSIGTAKCHLSRGMEKLRQHMETSDQSEVSRK